MEDNASTPNKEENEANAAYATSYRCEWERLFIGIDSMKPLKQEGIEGHLRSSRFRSVCWKVYLDVLGENVGKWIDRTRKWRNKYDELKDSLVVNPREAAADPTLHNPLSQEEESPWNRFFLDNELRLTVKQDVIRTYPEIEFFKEAGLQEKMIDVLFYYAKSNSKLGYRQGMHELLAPLIFVLHCDHQAFLHACEMETLDDTLKEVLDPKYIEHDAFALFSKIMETAEHWYVSRELSPTIKPKSVKSKPFARAQDFNPSNVIVNKLTRIQDYLLKKVDPDLYLHLEQLEIPPQVYGIRWLRLLFGREFAMQDLLVVWDAIFADSIGFELVDYIFVAMLLYLREALITSDYPTCLHFLMKYPPIGDINYFIQQALYLREPSQNPRPPAYTYQKPASLTNSSYGDMFQAVNGLPTTFIATSKSSSTNRNTAPVNSKMEKAGAMMTSGFASLSRRFSANSNSSQAQRARAAWSLPRQGSKAKSVPKMTMSETSSPVSEQPSLSFDSADRKVSSASLSRIENIPGLGSLRNGQSSQNGGSNNSSNSHTHARTHSLHLEHGTPADTSERARLRMGVNNSQDSFDTQQKLAVAYGRLHDMEAMCTRCASKMDTHIDKLQAQMLRSSLGCEDELLLALAGLKQVRDVLKGVLKPASLFDTEEIQIREDHYVQTPESPAPIQMHPRTGSESTPSTPDRSATSDMHSSNGRPDPMTPPVTPSAILQHELVNRSEVELKNFHRLETSYSDSDQPSSPTQRAAPEGGAKSKATNKHQH